jgi:DNA-directed RNA polymerase specialized sigma subunit
MKSRQQEDLELWEKWQKDRSQMTLNALLDRLNPLIQREVQKWGSAVPRPALESKARVLAVEALKTYNPNRGAAVGTHVSSRLRKLSRFVYPYQNVARLPENKQLNYNTFQVAQNQLYDTLGRDPSVTELSDNLGWTKKRVSDFQYTFARRELVESEGAHLDTQTSDDSLVDFYYHGLPPNDQRLFEDITGYGGRPVLNNRRLMGKYKLTQGQLSYRKRKFIDAIKNIQRGII